MWDDGYGAGELGRGKRRRLCDFSGLGMRRIGESGSDWVRNRYFGQIGIK